MFARPHWPSLRSAVSDLSWLLSRGYADKSTLKLVGDRFQLAQRQRIAVRRCACSDAARASRHGKHVAAGALRGAALLLDGFNVLTTIEAALAGGVLLLARDGCVRDMASMHGSYRKVRQTLPAIEMIGRHLQGLGVAQCVWYLDAPVSNSGRLKTILVEVAKAHDWPCDVQIVPNADQALLDAANVVATADSAVLDRAASWFNLATAILNDSYRAANMVDMGVEGGKDGKDHH